MRGCGGRGAVGRGAGGVVRGAVVRGAWCGGCVVRKAVVRGCVVSKIVTLIVRDTPRVCGDNSSLTSYITTQTCVRKTETPHSRRGSYLC